MAHSMDRREMIAGLSLLTGLVTFGPAASAAGRPTRILLRAGWQVENIGDVAHAPATIALIEKHIPNAEVTLWPFYDYLPDYEVAMLLRRFPKLSIVQGKLDENGKSNSPKLAAAVASSDLFLHASGPYALSWPDAAAFHKSTGKPFGVYGVTYGHWIFGNAEKETLAKASFAFFRDRVSLEKAIGDGIRPPVIGFSPDAAFALDLGDDVAGKQLIDAMGLKAGKFLCCIPKQRYTPTWLHERKKRAIDPRQDRRNEEMHEIDHRPLRDAITAVTRQTDMKVLICNEDETEVPIGKTWVFDRLSADVQAKTVWLDRPWLLPEAVGVYRQSAGLFGYEMHSPIICIANGIPALVGRWVEQSSKGTMWKDIGLGDWLFNMDSDEDVARLPSAVLQLAKDPSAARRRAEGTRKRVRARLAETMEVVRRASLPT